MKTLLKTLLLFFCASSIITSCKKDAPAPKLSEASGTVSLKLDGETINFTINHILLPYAFYCEDETGTDCKIEVGGRSENHIISILIWDWEKGNYSFNSIDSTGSNAYLLLISEKDRTNPADFVFGSINDFTNSNWNVSELQNLTLPDRDLATGAWKQHGRLDKMEVTFDATDENDKNVTEGYLNVSFK